MATPSPGVLRIGVDRIGLRALPSPAPPQLPASLRAWLVTVGHAVVRKVRGAPRSPMERLYPKP